MIKQKYQTFLDEYNRTSNVLRSALTAGYSYNYAWKLGKRIVNTAVKAKANDLARMANNKPVLEKEEAKELLCEILGIDRQLLSSTLKKIALNDKDYGSALKILAPLSKQAIGLDITNTDTPNITPSILNIGIINKDKEAIKTTVASNKDIKDIVEGEVIKQ